MHWANHPRRREDLVWCPDLNGTIATADGAKILVSIKGYSIIEETPTVNRAIVAAVWFQTDDPRYRWLNYHLGIAEGEIDETTEEWWIRISAVRNDVAKAPPKIEAAKWPVRRSADLLDDQVFDGRARLDLPTERRDLVPERRRQGARLEERLGTGVVLDEEVEAHEVVEFLHDFVRLDVVHVREQFALRDPVALAARREHQDALAEELPHLPVLLSREHRIHGLTDDPGERLFDALARRGARKRGRRAGEVRLEPGGFLRPDFGPFRAVDLIEDDAERHAARHGRHGADPIREGVQGLQALDVADGQYALGTIEEGVPEVFPDRVFPHLVEDRDVLWDGVSFLVAGQLDVDAMQVDAQGALVFRVVARVDVALDEARLADGAFADHVDLELEAAESQGLCHSVAGLKRPPGRLSAGQLCETNVRPRPNRRESFKCPGRHRISDHGLGRRREDHVG